MLQKRFENILLWAIKIGIFSIVFIPLIFNSKTFFPFIVMKEVSFRIMVEIIFCAYIFLVLQNNKYRPRFHVITIVVALYFIMLAISSLFGIDLQNSIWGNYERMGGLFRMLHIFLLFIVITSVFQGEKEWNALFILSILASIIMSFFALAQKLNVPFLLPSSGGDRLTGTIGNAIYLAAYILFHLYFLAYYFFHDRKFNLSLLVWGVLGADAFVVLYDMYSRAQGIPGSILGQLVQSRYFFLSILFFETLVVIFWILRSNKIAVRCFIAILFAFEMAVLFWTQTRGAMLGVYFGVIAFSVLGAIFQKEKQ